MSGDATRDAVDSKPSKSTDDQSNIWADIARDMAIGGGLGAAVGGPFGAILGTEAGLVVGALSNCPQAIEAAKHLYESAKELAENPAVQKAIKDLGQPIMLPDPAKQLVEEKTESLFKNKTAKTVAEIAFPPLAVYDFLRGK